jgi:hypothetical protein
MPFDQSAILSVNPPTYQGGMAFISWVSSAPAGTFYQVYESLTLVYAGTRTYCWVPIPSGPVRFDIGTVLPSEQFTSFASTLPVTSDPFAQLNWEGGSFESESIAGFYVYGSSEAGGAVEFATPLATITAYPQGQINDGWGLGGFGDGGFGESASYYSWVSDALTYGLWSFAVSPFDTAGNIGTPSTTSVFIYVPPLEPAANASGQRLTYTFNASTEEATLNWLASPSA